MLPGGLNPQQGIGIIPTLFGIHQGAITRPLICLRASCSGRMHACMQHVSCVIFRCLSLWLHAQGMGESLSHLQQSSSIR